MNTRRRNDRARPVSLITGAAGFIGMHVTAELIQRGHRIIALDDLSTGFRDNLPPEIEFIEGSITDARLVADLFRERRIDFVFHLAAHAAEGLSHFVRRHTYHNNVIGSAGLINASVQSGTVQCFVFVSSVAVYGDEPGPFSEDHNPCPIDPYGISKYATEMDLRAAFRLFGLRSIIFRPHNVYGEGQNLGDPHRNVIGIFMRQILEGHELSIFGDGLQTRAFTYISDVAPLVAAAVDREACYNRVYNIGGEKPYTILELAHKVSAAMEVPARIKFLPARFESAHTCCSHLRFQADFGPLSRPVELEVGLQRMAAWAKRVGVRRNRFGPAIEVNTGLPECWRNAEPDPISPLTEQKVEAPVEPAGFSATSLGCVPVS